MPPPQIGYPLWMAPYHVKSSRHLVRVVPQLGRSCEGGPPCMDQDHYKTKVTSQFHFLVTFHNFSAKF